MESIKKTEDVQNQEESKIVNLFEDMHQHTHDPISYSEMKKVPENQLKEDQNK